MQIFDALEKIGFSLWQVIIVTFAFYLRGELRMLFARLAMVKFGDTRWGWIR